MADTFTIEIATPERLLSREQAVRAQIPAKEGYIGVLPGHAALLSELGIGALTYVTPENHTHSMAISFCKALITKQDGLRNISKIVAALFLNYKYVFFCRF